VISSQAANALASEDRALRKSLGNLCAVPSEIVFDIRLGFGPRHCLSSEVSYLSRRLPEDLKADTKARKITNADELKPTPKGIRIPVPALKGRYPRPLDDGGTNHVRVGPAGFEPATNRL
jgi:hypothetical protein